MVETVSEILTKEKQKLGPREEERAEREAQQREKEQRFAAEQQQRWIDALQNAKPLPPVAAHPDSLYKNSMKKRMTWRLSRYI